ncbi:hypothetical protein ACPXCE_03540 [Streptomyces sp. DT24]|uniref:hypothetical protein n=1 Tax=unclassified Streptomyces TaxID=2593676 RepID=UPI0023B9FB25|nr:hypothetical protein [Streptomyces sp. AM 4-1-1]WEH37079.1 hypothetical protein PZB75_29190 [Streptomyces sp. AM 4-1-1]
MRKFAKALALVAIVAPIALGGAGVAAADPGHDNRQSEHHASGPGYYSALKGAGALGGFSVVRASGTDHDGNVFYLDSARGAGQAGAFDGTTFTRS